MIIKFSKMQSCGNDFVVIDLSQFININVIDTDFIKKICDRNFGIGCDLVIGYKTHNKSNKIDVVLWNSDGSIAEFCGNAARCIGLLMNSLGHQKCEMCIIPHSNISNNQSYKITSTDKSNTVFSLQKYKEIKPINISDLKLEKSTIKEYGIYNATFVNVENPHLILFLKKYPTLGLIKNIGKLLESHEMFPQKINVSFAEIISNEELRLIVFERGAGLTLSCGSGAYATVCAARNNKFINTKLDHKIVIHQRGGDLQIQFLEDESAMQYGCADFVFSGNIEINVNEQDIGISSNTSDIIVYTDGACSGNPGAGGWGAVILHGNDINEISGAEDNTTNNRMEIMATIKALEQLPNDKQISIYTDSQYVKNGITIWIENWVKNGWKGSDKKPVKNQDLWMQLLELSNNKQVEWHWVKGHDNNEYNNRADAIARSQCKKSK